LDKARVDHAKSESRFDRVEIAKKFVDEHQDNLENIHKGKNGMGYHTVSHPINSNHVPFPSLMTDTLLEENKIYGKPSDYVNFKGIKTVVHAEKDEPRVAEGHPL
jgi:hypothetical protein